MKLPLHKLCGFCSRILRLIVSHKRSRSSRSQVFFKIGVLENFTNFTGKHLCWSLQLYYKEIPRQVFSCEIWEIIKNTFFYRTLPVVASGVHLSMILKTGPVKHIQESPGKLGNNIIIKEITACHFILSLGVAIGYKAILN